MPMGISERTERTENRLIMATTNKERYPLFSNGTEFMIWQSRNCEQCVKAVFYNEKTDTYPKYRCAVQRHIEEAYVSDGCGNKRDYDVCRSVECPYKKTERLRRVCTRKDKSLTIEFK